MTERLFLESVFNAIQSKNLCANTNIKLGHDRISNVIAKARDISVQSVDSLTRRHLTTNLLRYINSNFRANQSGETTTIFSDPIDNLSDGELNCLCEHLVPIAVVYELRKQHVRLGIDVIGADTFHCAKEKGFL